MATNDATNGDTSGVRVFPPLFYLVAIAVGLLVQRLLPLRIGSDWRVIERAVGWIGIVLGLGLNGTAVLLFRRAGTTPNPTKPVTAFVVRGPYRYTRNPMYVGLTVFTIGVGLAADALWVSLLAFVAAAATQRLVIAKEEPYLECKFGDEYRAYRERVRRWM